MARPKKHIPVITYLTDEISINLINKAIELYKEGLNRFSILEIIKQDCVLKSKGDSYYQDILVRASSIINREYTKQIDTTIGLHITRYDKQLRSLIYKDFSLYDPKFLWKAQVTAWMTALETLSQKEKVLGLHRKKTTIKFNQTNNLTVKQTQPTYNLTNLSFEEKKEFLFLILKSKRTTSELFGVISSNTKTLTEDIQHEEIVDNKPNIDSIKVEEPKTAEYEKTNTAILDIKTKLAETLRKKAQEEFIKAGSKTADKEPI